MARHARVDELLAQVLDTARSPDAVCAAEPELLPLVRERWDECRAVEAAVEALFPPAVGAAAAASTGREAAAGRVASTVSRGERLPDVKGYDVEAVLGRGGMGVVYRARQVTLRRPVAIKMLLAGGRAAPAERARLLREARAVAALRHPHVVQVYEVGEHDGDPFFTMELMEGGTLARRIAAAPQQPRDAARLVESIAGAVDAAHRAGVCHRDLKPANVLLAVDGTPKVSDFGLAHVSGGADDPMLTLPGSRMGTPSYMSPEQAGGRRAAVGPATDVHGLGAILYAMLTGRPPFLGDSTADTERQVVEQDPVAPSRLAPRVPRDLETICLKCLAKDPGRRYASAAALADDLRRFLSGEPVHARPVGRVSRAGKWVRRRPAAAASLALAAVLVLAGMTVASRWASDRAAAVRTAERELREASRLQRDQKWTEAESALYRAAIHVGGRSFPDLRARLDAGRANLAAVARLDALRAEGDANVPVTVRRARYESLCRELGLGEGYRTEPHVVAARVLGSDARAALAAMFYDWLGVTVPFDDAKLRWLTEVALIADAELNPDPGDWRRRALDTAAWRDPAAASTLEADPAVARQSVGMLMVVRARIVGAGRDPLPFLRNVQRCHPGHPVANSELGEALRAKGCAAEAVRYGQAAVALRPTSAAARFRLAQALVDDGRLGDAIVELREARRSAPDAAYVQRALGLRLAEAGHWAEAVPELQAVVARVPIDVSAQAGLGISFEGLGRFAEASAAFRDAVRWYEERAKLRAPIDPSAAASYRLARQRLAAAPSPPPAAAPAEN